MSRPNLFLIAAPRAGSTQLAHWLASHKDITLSPVKEPNYFSAHEFDPNYVRASHLNDVDPTSYTRSRSRRPAQFAVFRQQPDYEALFSDMTTPWRMEASTSYLACPEAPAAIHAYAPNARLIILTRDPYERALSHYRLALRTGRTCSTLEDTLHAEINGQPPLAARFLLRPSRYGAGISRIQALFEPDQCLFIKFETLIDEPKITLSHIAKWLDIDAAGFDISHQARNASAMPRFARTNILLERCGLKTALRRILPPALKPFLKRLWFDPTSQIPIPKTHRAALAGALAMPQEQP